MPEEELPIHLLEELKDEMEALKKKLLQPEAKAQELILEIESLKDSIHELSTIFQKALQEAKEEDGTTLLRTINERMEAVVSQNETIAKGMIAISDKVEDFISKARLVQLPPMMPTALPSSPLTMGVPPLRGARTAPYPEAPLLAGSPELGEDFEMPPPPPGPGKKRIGLFK